MRFVGWNSTHWLSLALAFAAYLPEGLFAEEPSPALSVSPKEADSEATAAARRVWSILAAVEQSHVAAPTRTELGRAIAFTLSWPDEFSASEAVGDAIGECRDADEFVALFARRWRDERRPTGPIKQLAENVVKALDDSAKWGDFRLLTKKDYAVQEQFRGNRYVGLGVALSKSASEYAQFATIIPGGPAHRSGIKADTIVMEVDGHSTKNAATQEIIDWIRGPVGTDVTLKIADADDRRVERVVTIKRGFVRFNSVSGFGERGPISKPLDSEWIQFKDDLEIGYLRLIDITGSTLQELRDAEVKLRKAKVRAMVLDLRSGARTDTFHQARLVADGLLDGGTLWQWQERDLTPRTELADRECLMRGLPLVVVVDKSTSGPQAAIAAALQDAGRAVVVGASPNFDGLVMSGVELADGVHVLEMGTARIIRSRADRRWPLKPDFETPVEEVLSSEIVDGSVVVTDQTTARKPTPLKSDAPAKSNPEPKGPQELTKEHIRGLQPARLTRQRRHTFRQDPIPLAHQVIRKLLDQKPDESKEATNRE